MLTRDLVGERRGLFRKVGFRFCNVIYVISFVLTVVLFFKLLLFAFAFVVVPVPILKALISRIAFALPFTVFFLIFPINIYDFPFEVYLHRAYLLINIAHHSFELIQLFIILHLLKGLFGRGVHEAQIEHVHVDLHKY